MLAQHQPLRWDNISTPTLGQVDLSIGPTVAQRWRANVGPRLVYGRWANGGTTLCQWLYANAVPTLAQWTNSLTLGQRWHINVDLSIGPTVARQRWPNVEPTSAQCWYTDVGPTLAQCYANGCMPMLCQHWPNGQIHVGPMLVYQCWPNVCVSTLAQPQCANIDSKSVFRS